MIFLIFLFSTSHIIAQANAGSVFAKKNLVAWCIVPFDNQNRSPEQRAEMLNRLGITKLAYDWREKHIPFFDEELDALKSHNIQLQAFWFASGPDPAHDRYLDTVLSLFERHQVHTQLWCMFNGAEGFDSLSQQEKMVALAKPVAYVAGRLAAIGCTLGLYNHGGWFGEPENQLAIISYLGMTNIGIVYNFSHSETQIQRFPDFFPKILPHLLCINLTGLKGGYPATVVPVGEGNIEKDLIRRIRNSSYDGPIGIINEDFAPDAEAGLQLNMEGLKRILNQLGDEKAVKTY